MADIQKIKINNIIYNLKDATARAAIEALPSPMVFKGTIGTGGTITSLPTATVSNEGYTYKVITNISSPITAKVGDTVISNGSTWVVIPSGDEPSGTVTNIATGTGLTGGPITTSGTISHATSGVSAGTYGSASVVPVFTVNNLGHITGVTNKDISVQSVANTNSSVGGVQKFWRGTSEQYNAITTKSDDTLYIVTDETDGENTFVSLSMLNNIIAPEFDSSTSYVAGELVLHNGSLYKRNSSGSGAWSTSNWTQTTISAVIKELITISGTSININ